MMHKELIPPIEIKSNLTLKLSCIKFKNSSGTITFKLSEPNFNNSEYLLLETKILYFPLLQLNLHSRSTNMLLDEYFEIDLELNSLIQLANQLRDEDNQYESNLKINNS